MLQFKPTKALPPLHLLSRLLHKSEFQDWKYKELQWQWWQFPELGVTVYYTLRIYFVDLF